MVKKNGLDGEMLVEIMALSARMLDWEGASTWVACTRSRRAPSQDISLKEFREECRKNCAQTNVLVQY